MNGITRDFAPPFKLIAPYFLVGTLFYLISAIALFSLNSSSSHLELSTLAWVHLYLLGFVMMVIFGAMAQLVPVVIEVGHAFVDFFYIIYPLLSVGTILMVSGFVFEPALLPLGGVLVLISMAVFAADLFFTLRKGNHKSIVVSIMGSSNVFLLLGILSGFVMALAFGGVLSIDPAHWLKAHVFAVFGGYVILTIMGLSMVLLPMFGLSHGFDEKPINFTYKLMLFGVPGVMLGSLMSWPTLEGWSVIAILTGISSYFYQVYLIFKTRARKENDVWVKSLFFAFASLLLSVLLSIGYLLSGAESLLMASGWFLVAGFTGFLITSHLYKIIPFLVWFERYAPLVGKQKVPMLHEMVPKKQADAQMKFSIVGTLLVGLSFLLQSDSLFDAGVSFMVVSALYLTYSVYTMMQYGKELV